MSERDGAEATGTLPESVKIDRWKRIEDLFAEACDQAEADRPLFVARACGNDCGLRDEVMSLLASMQGASDSLRSAVSGAVERFASDRSVSLLGHKLGAYRLSELIGEGGMGAVYLAERDDAEYKCHVAIKILRNGFGSPHAIARLRDERQILAALEHPGIVRLLDGGHTDDGIPYLVMERVVGVPITQHARMRNLPLRARIELLLKICAALQYAHGKLVVHRDIKPSNILVGEDRVLKLLDFGIAKLLDPDAASEREARTRTGVALLTPEYASPEQVRGEPVSVATDVYSLGAVMYELLGGQPPQRPTGGPLELLKTICEVDPPRPSTIAPAELQREIAGDLDNIIMKALQKEPARRYASIEQLADDLRRYLDGMPVSARTATSWYRAGKFVRRNRGKLALGLIVVTALSAATIVSIREARRADAAAQRARERFDEVRRLSNSLLFEIDEAIRDVAGTTRARELVVSRALMYLDRLAHEAAYDPGLSQELAIAYMKIGDIQGSPYEPNIGKTADGLKSYEKANALLARVSAQTPEFDTIRLRAAFGTGFMYHTMRDVTRARTALAEAIDLAKRAGPGVEVDRISMARAYLALAFIEKAANNIAESDKHTDDGLAYVATWDPQSADARYFRAVFLLRRAEAAARRGDPVVALGFLDEVLAIHERLGIEYPNVGKYPRERIRALLLLSMVTSGVGDSMMWVANTNHLDRAEAGLRDGLKAVERLAADDPENADLLMLVAAFRTSLGLVIMQRSPRDAAPMFESAFTAFEQFPLTFRRSTYARENEFIAHCAYARSLAVLGKREQALTRASHGLELAQGQSFNVALCESLVAAARLALGDRDAAASHYEAVANALRPAADKPDTAGLIGLVETLEQLARLRPAQACALRTEAVERWRIRANTDYLRRRLAELEAAARDCDGGATRTVNTSRKK